MRRLALKPTANNPSVTSRPADQSQRRKTRKTAATGIVAAIALTLSACSTGSSAADPSATSAKAASIAYFAFAVSGNSFATAQADSVKAEAKAEGAALTVFDAAGNAQKQYSQIQDALASGKYNGFLIDAVDGAGLVSVVKQALTQGIKVVGVNSALGPDLASADPQVPGMSGSIVQPAVARGITGGKLVVKACAAKKNPCQVGYIFNYKGTGVDTGTRQGFDKVIDKEPTIKVIAEGQAMYSAAGGLSATQTILQQAPGVDVIFGADQGMQGATQALQSAKNNNVLVVGMGGSQAGLARVKSGEWFGDVPVLPSTQGKLGTEAIINAVRSGKSVGGVNPAADLPDAGLATTGNVNEFTGQWAG